jgi:hypothetical protein
MKKSILNLSLLMLLSASSNVSAMSFFNKGKNAYTIVSKSPVDAETIITSVTENLEKASKAVANGDEAVAQTALEAFVNSAEKLDDIAPSLLPVSNPQTTNMLTKLGNVFCGLSQSPKFNFIKKPLSASYNGLVNLPNLARQHPVAAGCVAAFVVGVGAAAAYKYRTANLAGASGQNLVNPNSNSVVIAVDDLQTGQTVNETEHCELSPEQHTRGGAAAISSSEARDHEISPDLKAEIDKTIDENDGDVNALLPWGNENRTLLMYYAEANQANIDAIKYLVEVKNADVNKKNNMNRTVHNYAAFWGKPEILEYLLQHTEPGSIDLDYLKNDAKFATGHQGLEAYLKILELL